MKIKVLSSISNATLTPSSPLIKTSSITSQNFNSTVISPVQTKTPHTKTTERPDVTFNHNDNSFSSRTTVKNIVKTTKQSIHRLMKKIKNIQSKRLFEDKSLSQILNKNKTSDNEWSPSSNTFTSHGSDAVNNALHKNVEEKPTVYNSTKSPFYFSASSKGANNDGEPLSQNPKISLKINNSLQRTYKPIDSQNSNRKVNQNQNQNSSLTDSNSNIKPPLDKKETQDIKSLGGTTPTKKEIDLGKDRILIWNELKDCAQPFGTTQEKPVKDDFQSLNPSKSGRIDQWEYNKELNKRVLSSPSFNVGTVTVRAEEIGLVLVILLLWAGAISLFINRWGKLRMLEPYQPQYTAPEPPQPQRPAPAVPPFININIQSTSSMSLNDNYRHTSPVGSFGEWGYHGGSSDHLSPRRSIGGMYSMSAGVERSPSMMMTPLSSQRRVRSAVDLVSLVMQEKMNSGSQFAATNV